MFLDFGQRRTNLHDTRRGLGGEARLEDLPSLMRGGGKHYHPDDPLGKGGDDGRKDGLVLLMPGSVQGVVNGSRVTISLLLRV